MIISNIFARVVIPCNPCFHFIQSCQLIIPFYHSRFSLRDIIPGDNGFNFITPELEFIKLNPIAVLLDLRNLYAQTPLKTIDLDPLTKQSNSLHLIAFQIYRLFIRFHTYCTVFDCEYELWKPSVNQFVLYVY
jgi:hypothetical protein